MPRPTTCQLFCTKALWVLLLLPLLLTGCRSSDQPAEKKTADQKITAPAPLLPPPFTLAPVVSEPKNIAPEDGPAVSDEQHPSPQAAQPTNTQQLASPSPVPQRPRMAIIIDDMGHHQQLGRKFLELDLNLSYSFLPDAPYSRELATGAFAIGRDILVHLPMEPKNGVWNSGSGGLAVQDPPEMVRQKTARMLEAVPHAVGASNHMGSRFTEDAEAIQTVLEIVKSHELFFIDSYTTAASRGLFTARQLGVPAARRHVFLDNVQEPLKICGQLDQLVAMAQKQGWAIGIGHPYRATLAALHQCDRGRLNEVEIVGVHRLVQ
ncbi:MAG: divergent polysaccharide deacetylase family protein [Desulfobulbaceae bacterium]|nr:divergent polysaccharide deacetylase family protein [Desulfobulbaceae bacterium]